MSIWLEHLRQLTLRRRLRMSRKMGVNNKGEMFDPMDTNAVPMTAEEAAKMKETSQQNVNFHSIKDKVIDEMNAHHSPADLDDDPVNPAHYMSYYKDGIDCITAMKHAFGEEAVQHFCITNAFKYIWRHMSKNGMQDIEKAVWYLNKYLELNK